MADIDKTFDKLSIVERAKLQGRANEIEIAKKYFAGLGLNPWHIVIILGIAISGLATFVNTFDAFVKINGKTINSQQQSCINADADTKRLVNIQFIVILVAAILAVILGIIVAWLLRGAANRRRIITLGIIFTGVFGILYAISIKLQSSEMSSLLKAGLSGTVFIGFLIAGFIYGRKTPNVQVVLTPKKEIDLAGVADISI